MTYMSLNEAPPHIELDIQDIDECDRMKNRLLSMGIHVGDKIIKYNGSSWCPVLIKNITSDSSKIALGHRMASKIRVGFNP